MYCSDNQLNAIGLSGIGLPLSYDNWTTTSSHNPLRMCTARDAKMAQSLPGVQLRHFSTTCAVQIEDCEGWWNTGCTRQVSWVRFLVTASIFSILPQPCKLSLQ